MHLFDIATSKSGPTMVCFAHFDLEMCFAPQRRALFRHRNFQKWSDIGAFCAFCLPNVLRATTACTFSTSQLPKVVRSSSVLSILTWKCASRHNGMHFFMSHLASWLRTRRFSEPTFRPSGATNHWKNTVNRDFPIFSRIYLFFLLIFSLLTLLTSAFQLSILSEVSLLNFLRLSLLLLLLSVLLSLSLLSLSIVSIIHIYIYTSHYITIISPSFPNHFPSKSNLPWRRTSSMTLTFLGLMIVATPTSTSGSSLRFLGAVFNMARRPEPGNPTKIIGKTSENCGKTVEHLRKLWETCGKWVINHGIFGLFCGVC